MENSPRKYVVICDIDNCFTDSREWMKYVPKVDAKDKSVARAAWDKYQTFSFLAKPNKSIINLVLATSNDLPIYFVTSREDRKNSRKETIQQIEEFSEGKIKIDDTNKLCMRKEFDYRASSQVKKDILINMLQDGCIPVIAIDDEEENCKMFAEMGIPAKLYNIETDTFVKTFNPQKV